VWQYIYRYGYRSVCGAKRDIGLYNAQENVGKKTLPWQPNFDRLHFVTCDLQSILSTENNHTQ
jgi:hypothetical protein